MSVIKLIGDAPNQVSRNKDLGDLAYQDAANIAGNVGVGGALTVQAGTAALPSIAPTGDANTGLFFPAADTIAFSEGGAEVMRLDSSGNVGIGTSSPGAKLHVSGSFRVGTASDYFQVNQTNTNVWSILNSPAGTYSIVFNNATANVGINLSGVTPVASAILDVQSTTKGVRMPNMTTTQKNAIASPAAGLMVFDTTLSKLCVYSGAAWETITSV